MRVRALDSNGDWTFGKGQNDYKTGLAALMQNIQTRLKSFLGDCFFDTGAGIDWFNLLGSKNQIALSLAISTVILNTDGVTGVVALSVDLNDTTRVFTTAYTINTIYGTASGTVSQSLGV